MADSPPILQSTRGGLVAEVRSDRRRLSAFRAGWQQGRRRRSRCGLTATSARSCRALFCLPRTGRQRPQRRACGSTCGRRPCWPADSGAVPIVPGKPEASEVVRRIFNADASEMMPPPAANKPLTKAEQTLLKRWIAEGARYEPHWAFMAPERRQPPAVKQRGVASQRDRQFHPGPAGTRGAASRRRRQNGRRCSAGCRST